MTHDGILFGCLKAGQTKEAGKSFLAGSGAPNITHMAQARWQMWLSVEGPAMQGGRCALSPEPGLPPFPQCHLLHPVAQVPQVGLPFRFHCQPCPSVTRQWLCLPRAQPSCDHWATRGPCLLCVPSPHAHCVGPCPCSGTLCPVAVLSWGRWMTWLLSSSLMLFPSAQQRFASVGICRTLCLMAR